MVSTHAPEGYEHVGLFKSFAKKLVMGVYDDVRSVFVIADVVSKFFDALPAELLRCMRPAGAVELPAAYHDGETAQITGLAPRPGGGWTVSLRVRGARAPAMLSKSVGQAASAAVASMAHDVLQQTSLELTFDCGSVYNTNLSQFR
jgi:hypothetical protein